MNQQEEKKDSDQVEQDNYKLVEFDGFGNKDIVEKVNEILNKE